MALFLCPKMEVIEMILVWILIGAIIGGNLTLLVYSCILAGKDSDRKM